jgi:intracellular sulfur oxidation DsrE/DsrF family protein
MTMRYQTETGPSGQAVRRTPRRLVFWAAAAIVLLLAGAFALMAYRSSRAHPQLAFPRVQAAGGVLTVDPGATMPSAQAIHRVLVDVDNDDVMYGKVNARLNTAAKILNLYALAGVPAANVHMVMLFYGTGVNLILSDAAYQRKFGHANPNAELLSQLHKANVQMVACGQATGHQSITAADVQSGVTMALSALTAREELQAAGYGSVPVEAR